MDINKGFIREEVFSLVKNNLKYFILFIRKFFNYTIDSFFKHCTVHTVQ